MDTVREVAHFQPGCENIKGDHIRALSLKKTIVLWTCIDFQRTYRVKLSDWFCKVVEFKTWNESLVVPTELEKADRNTICEIWRRRSHLNIVSLEQVNDGICKMQANYPQMQIKNSKHSSGLWFSWHISQHFMHWVISPRTLSHLMST